MLKNNGLGRRRNKFRLGLRRQVDPVTIHGITTVLALLFMALIHKTLNFTMGHDARIYDVIPLRYLIDTVDLVVFARFALNVWREFR